MVCDKTERKVIKIKVGGKEDQKLDDWIQLKII